ncbi:hypothetical protein KFE96_06305 [Kordiimonas sp. SCSIO 12603]|uniref:hypothetical protein n=1 Tax=Kordiimonas sp. SCSIO 12603 TaxID=2829596 RepID=UPI0021045ADD|nr:hypothetical protein [Kordiimonas sp. SCSIO 12603]UTW59911.1 hypothetical protein KFE96_06305 [Kordiimonas sp. SCSIO 12603]
MFKKIAIAAAFFGFALSGETAQARTFDFYTDTFSDVGTYAPVGLGEDLTINACGSALIQGPVTGANIGTQPRWSLCDIPDLSSFELTYYASEASATALTAANIIATFSGADVAGGLTTTFATGAGTVFSSPGNYLLGLAITLPQGELVALANGDIVTPGGDCGLITSLITFQPAGCTIIPNSNQPQINGARDTGFATTTITVEPAAVPEPSAILLLLPLMFGLAYFRQQRPALVRVKTNRRIHK